MCGRVADTVLVLSPPPQEKKLTEEELKNQLKYRTVLAVKNNKYEDVCAWWLVVLVCVAV